MVEGGRERGRKGGGGGSSTPPSSAGRVQGPVGCGPPPPHCVCWTGSFTASCARHLLWDLLLVVCSVPCILLDHGVLDAVAATYTQVGMGMGMDEGGGQIPGSAMLHEVHAGFLQDDQCHALALDIHRSTGLHNGWGELCTPPPPSDGAAT